MDRRRELNSYLGTTHCDVHLLEPLICAEQGPVLIFHEALFDLQCLWYQGLVVPHGRRLFDTRIAAKVLEASGDHKRLSCELEDVAQRYLGITMDKERASRRCWWSGRPWAT